MVEQIQVELDENLIEKSEKILNYYGIDMQTAVKIFLNSLTNVTKSMED